MATRLCAVNDVPRGGTLRVELTDDVEIAVVRSDDGEIFAIEDICSHANFPLSDGDLSGTTIECALHGSFFDLRTGDPTGPPATRPVTTYPVTVVDDQVFVELADDAISSAEEDGMTDHAISSAEEGGR